MTSASRRYLIHDPVRRNAIRTVDLVLDALPSSQPPAVPSSPQRILLALGGHLGDAIIATSALALTRELLPDAEIGVIGGSWSRSVLDGNPLVNRIHVIDHWMLNRAEPWMGGRMRRYAATWRTSLQELRRLKYDMAIDLYPYFPNSALLLRLAGVPVRVGYTSGGFGPLYTHPVDFAEETAHQVEQQAQVITQALGKSWGRERLHYRLPPIGETLRRSAEKKLAAAGVAPSGYIVVHMSAATSPREWLREKWRETIERLVGEGNQIVCTGLHGRESENAARTIDGLSNCVNLCGQLAWGELLAVLSRARAVVSVDTAVGHAAAAFDVPTVTLMTTIAKAEYWRPYNARGRALSHPMPCAPCFAREGCEHMRCIRDVTVDDVMTAVHGVVQPQ